MFLYVGLRTWHFGTANLQKKWCLRSPPRHETSTTDAEPGRVGRVEQGQEPPGTARREVVLSSSYLEDKLKPGLNRSLRPLSCQRQHIYTCVHYKCIYNNKQQQRPSNAKRKPQNFSMPTCSVSSSNAGQVRVNSTTTNSMLQQRKHQQYDKQQAVFSVIFINNNNMLSLWAGT